MKRARALRLALGLTIALAAHAASAQQCSISAAGPLTFTGYSPFAGPAYASASVTVSCNGNGAHALTIGVTTANNMTATGVPGLAFSNYQDAAHSAPWTSTTQLPITVTGSPAPFTVFYGMIAANQDVAATTYSTQLTVTLYGTGGQSLGTIPMTVQATVAANCVITSGNLAFGNYDGLLANATTPLNAQGSFGVSCTLNTPYTVSLDYGTSGSGTTRQMANGSARLTYQIYSDPGRTTPWTPTATVGGTAPNVSEIILTPYGQILAGQLVPTGSYSDTVTATVAF
jgi:spore coat protein U-like protein